MRRERLFWLFFILILVAAFAIRIIPPQNHNFFFTMDQADDGVWAREFFERKQLLWHGPRTNIPGVYTGPLWYYFISIGYLVFGGDPFGALFMLILLNTALTGVLMWMIKRNVGGWQALALGFSLQIFWWFYDTSRWAFNPFPLVATGMGTLLLLCLFFKGEKKALIWASVFVFLGFNFEIAGAGAIFFFYLLVVIWTFLTKRIQLKQLVYSLVLPTVYGGVIAFAFGNRFLANVSGQTLPGEPTKYFSGTNFSYMAGKFLEILSYAVVPYHLKLSLFVFILLILWFWRKKNPNLFVRSFVLLSLTLFVVCFIFFGSNKGWYDWHTVYLAPILFTAFLLLVLSLGQRTALVFLTVSLLLQFRIFKERYLEYMRPYNDPGILATELEVVDWIYANREGDGFKVYTYMPARRDYPYQYLFWWHGRKKYGFVPCEYSIYPKGLKLYVPGKEFYTKPQLGCDKFVFLIIEPQHDKAYFDGWYKQTSSGTVLLDTSLIDKVLIEKRRYKRQEEL